MNIFILDNDIEKSATYYIDRHIVKIPTEIAQLLCNARHFYGDTNCKYKLTHTNHPWSKFTRESIAQYLYVVAYGVSLCSNYSARYAKRHGALDVIADCYHNVPNKLFSFEERYIDVKTEFERVKSLSRMGYFNRRVPICVPADCLTLEKPVESYRQAYMKHKVFDKRGKVMAKWKYGKPDWYKDLYNVL